MKRKAGRFNKTSVASSASERPGVIRHILGNLASSNIHRETSSHLSVISVDNNSSGSNSNSFSYHLRNAAVKPRDGGHGTKYDIATELTSERDFILDEPAELSTHLRHNDSVMGFNASVKHRFRPLLYDNTMKVSPVGPEDIL